MLTGSEKRQLQIASKLKEARKIAGYNSAKEFAKEQGIAYQTYTQHESGKRRLTSDTIEKYARILQVSPSFFFSAENNTAYYNEPLSPDEISSFTTTRTPQFISKTKATHSVCDKSLFMSIVERITDQIKASTLTYTYLEITEISIDIYNHIISISEDKTIQHKMISSVMYTLSAGMKKRTTA